MRQPELIRQLSMNELYAWLAYDMASDQEFKQKTLREDDLLRQRQAGKEEEAKRLLQFFKGLNKNASK